MNIKLFRVLTIFLIAWFGVIELYSAEKSMKVMEDQSIENNDNTQYLQLKTLFLSKEIREKIDQQREAYLTPVVEKKVVKLLSKKEGRAGSQKKRIYIPPKVNVSLVMVKPDGSRLVRVNDKYNRSPSKHIKIDFSNSTKSGVPVNVLGRMQMVPVGSTLLTRKNKLVKTYKLEQVKSKKLALKTEQKAVKQRLEQVKILQPE